MKKITMIFFTLLLAINLANPYVLKAAPGQTEGILMDEYFSNISNHIPRYYTFVNPYIDGRSKQLLPGQTRTAFEHSEIDPSIHKYLVVPNGYTFNFIQLKFADFSYDVIYDKTIDYDELTSRFEKEITTINFHYSLPGILNVSYRLDTANGDEIKPSEINYGSFAYTDAVHFPIARDIVAESYDLDLDLDGYTLIGHEGSDPKGVYTLEDQSIILIYEKNENVPPVDPVDPPVKPTDPPVDPVDPPVKPTDPPIDPVDPPVTPINPPIKPVDPPVTPTEPPTKPINPPVQPLDPPTTPVETPKDNTPDSLPKVDNKDSDDKKTLPPTGISSDLTFYSLILLAGITFIVISRKFVDEI